VGDADNGARFAAGKRTQHLGFAQRRKLEIEGQHFRRGAVGLFIE
jgi:hypothetical protein